MSSYQLTAYVSGSSVIENIFSSEEAKTCWASLSDVDQQRMLQAAISSAGTITEEEVQEVIVSFWKGRNGSTSR